MVQRHLPDGVLGEMSYRMSGPLTDGRFAEAVDSGVHVFANALAEKVGFKVSDIERRRQLQRTRPLRLTHRNRSLSVRKTRHARGDA